MACRLKLKCVEAALIDMSTTVRTDSVTLKWLPVFHSEDDASVKSEKRR